MEAPGDQAVLRIRRAVSWLLTTALLVGTYLAIRLLPGADGVADEIRWTLEHPSLGRIDRAQFLLTVLDLRERGASGRVIEELFHTTGPQSTPRLLELVWISSAPGSHVAWETFIRPVALWLLRTPAREWEPHTAQLARIWNAFSQAVAPPPEWDELSGHIATELLTGRLKPQTLIRCSQSPDVYASRGALLMLLAGEPHAIRQECLRRMRETGIEIGRTATFQDGVTPEFSTAPTASSILPPLDLRVAGVLEQLLSDADPSIRCPAAQILIACGDLKSLAVLRDCATLDNRIGEDARRVLSNLQGSK